MNIQANINQLLSIAAVAARLDPTLEARTEAGTAQRQLAKAEKKLNVIDIKAKGSPLTSDEKKHQIKVNEEVVGAAEKIFKIKPTLANYETFSKQLGKQQKLKEETAQNELQKRKASLKQELRDRAEAEREFAEQTRREEIRNALLNWRS